MTKAIHIYGNKAPREVSFTADLLWRISSCRSGTARRLAFDIVAATQASGIKPGRGAEIVVSLSEMESVGVTRKALHRSLDQLAAAGVVEIAQRESPKSRTIRVYLKPYAVITPPWNVKKDKKA